MEKINYNLTETNLTIYDSYKVSKKKFKPFLKKVKNENPNVTLFKERKIWHMCLEWATHNFFHKLKIEEDRTKNCDLNYPQKWYIKLGYIIMGCIGWIFIK